MISQEFLQKIPIFEKLSGPDFDVLGKLWKQRKLRKGEVLFRFGELGTSMVVIEEGNIAISVPVENEHKLSDKKGNIRFACGRNWSRPKRSIPMKLPRFISVVR